MEFVFHTKTPGERGRLREALSEFATAHGISKSDLSAVDLALEEHLTNILSYGFTGQDEAGEREIGVECALVAGELRVQIVDDGRPFNPLEYPKPDLTVPAEERPIGGLGIHMMRESMDRAEYSRVDGRNRLVLFKKLR